MIIDKKDFLNKSAKTLADMLDLFNKLSAVSLTELNVKETALVIVDMVNGFTRDGVLKSPRIEGLIPEINKLSKMCDKFKIPKLAFADCHAKDSPEFDSYPVHCMSGTYESEIVDEIKDTGGYGLIFKNSTNGFIEEGFQKWLAENKHVNTYIITGDCTDICIQQFSVTLKTWFNMQDRKSRVIVPVNAVETYDLALHNGDLMNVMALYNMLINGVELVKGVE
ncbi:MAG: isochorismatase family cysteine hydrolase [Bacillota bacterium]|nr:isochorismatase family cysteine hydrolase [Bacillota bacterium]